MGILANECFSYILCKLIISVLAIELLSNNFTSNTYFDLSGLPFAPNMFSDFNGCGVGRVDSSVFESLSSFLTKTFSFAPLGGSESSESASEYKSILLIMKLAGKLNGT